MSFNDNYKILNEYNKCDIIKNEYIQCLQNESNSKICKTKLVELLDCIKTNKAPSIILSKTKNAAN